MLIAPLLEQRQTVFKYLQGGPLKSIYLISSLLIILALQGCQSGYEVRKKQACEDYKKYIGREVVCDKDIVVGFVDTYKGMTCSDLMSGRIAAPGGYFWATNAEWNVLREEAVKECERQSQKSCMIVIENGECVLDRENQKLLVRDGEKKSNSSKKNKEADIGSAKRKCADLGFLEGTEKFGECVLKITR